MEIILNYTRRIKLAFTVTNSNFTTCWRYASYMMTHLHGVVNARVMHNSHCTCTLLSGLCWCSSVNSRTQRKDSCRYWRNRAPNVRNDFSQKTHVFLMNENLNSNWEALYIVLLSGRSKSKNLLKKRGSSNHNKGFWTEFSHEIQV